MRVFQRYYMYKKYNYCPSLAKPSVVRVGSGPMTSEVINNNSELLVSGTVLCTGPALFAHCILLLKSQLLYTQHTDVQEITDF